MAADQAYPQSTNGKVFGRIDGVGTYQRSATVVRARNRSLVFTAGHCIKEPGGRWARDFVFVPSYRQGQQPFGAWVWRRMMAPAEGTRQGNFNFDYGGVVMTRRAGVPVERAVGGGQGFAWSQPRRARYRSFGYPANRLAGSGCGAAERATWARTRVPRAPGRPRWGSGATWASARAAGAGSGATGAGAST